MIFVKSWPILLFIKIAINKSKYIENALYGALIKIAFKYH